MKTLLKQRFHLLFPRDLQRFNIEQISIVESFLEKQEISSTKFSVENLKMLVFLKMWITF